MLHRSQTNRIIFHHSLTDGGDVESIRKYHIEKNKWEDIGYHYVIPKEGHFQVGRDIKMIGAHAKGRNGDSVGICLVGDFSKTEPTESQMNESLKLYHDICRYFSKNLIIEFHRDGRLWNACPGKKLDRDYFKHFVYRGMI